MIDVDVAVDLVVVVVVVLLVVVAGELVSGRATVCVVDVCAMDGRDGRVGFTDGKVDEAVVTTWADAVVFARIAEVTLVDFPRDARGGGRVGDDA